MTYGAPPEPFNGPLACYDLASSPSYSCEPSSQKQHRDDDDHDGHHHQQKTRSFSPTTSFHAAWSCDPPRQTTSQPPTMRPPPFDVPKPWQAAMTMVSINAGLTPQAVLHHYYKLQPQQASLHPGYTELDIWKSQRAMDRGIKSVHVRYLDNDPSRIYMLVITIDHFDPAIHRDMIRLVTTTSLRHVLEEEPCANCPLWLPVKVDAAALGGAQDGGPGETSPYQLVPCCDDWVAAMNFDAPISAEEKQVPKVVDRLILEVHKKKLLLEAKEKELQDKEEELVGLRERNKTQVESDIGLGTAAATPGFQREQHVLGCDVEMLVQYWWAVAIFLAFLMVVVLR